MTINIVGDTQPRLCFRHGSSLRKLCYHAVAFRNYRDSPELGTDVNRVVTGKKDVIWRKDFTTKTSGV